MVRRVTAPLPRSGERLRTRGSVCLTTWRRSVTPGPPLPPRREAWRIHNRRTRMGRERAAEAGTGRPPAVARATPWPVGAGPGTGVEADPRPFSLSPFRRHPRRRRGGEKGDPPDIRQPLAGAGLRNCSTDFGSGRGNGRRGKSEASSRAAPTNAGSDTPAAWTAPRDSLGNWIARWT